ncbi:hypothetical protein [Klebsiella pneumoniae]|uniref:hypothetical protein n=1 Tax=Klebsiella pneumoniae TaxID=573 RepID=UPI002265BE57|nr:hypothetical protein [Klebsiella pneumoniae]
MAQRPAADAEIYAFVPQRVVVDAHPGYRSTVAASLPLPLETVLHHHAHAAACGGAPLAT